jgi:type II secretory pathway pseudopilin PulG
MARPSQPESGFALLLVFMMASVIAIMLYLSMPRVIFEAQRNKEQLLIDRGEQYMRAIQLYSRKFNGQFPARLEQLENTNNMRFLRRRYKDPMTGSDEWRLIHIGPGGIFPDSLTLKPPQKKKPGESDSSGETPTEIAGQQQGQPPVPGPAFRRGASDRGVLGTGGGPAPGQGGEDASNSPPPEAVDPTAGAEQADTGEAQPAQPLPGVIPGQPPPGTPPQPGISFQPGRPPMGVQGGIETGQPFPGQGGIVTGAVAQPGTPQPYNLRGGLGTFPPPTAPQQQSGTPDAVSIPQQIMQTLQRPNRGLQGSAGGLTIGGGGIAGVASKAEFEGIKVYRKHTKYNEWEFIYDPRNDPSTPAGRQAMMGFPPGVGAKPPGSGGINQKQN